MNWNLFKHKKFHYVYKITDPQTGDFYIGVRSSNQPCELDKYMSSGNWSDYKKADFSGKIKTLINSFFTREEADREERREIAKHAGNPKLKNKLGRHSNYLTKTRNLMGLTQRELAKISRETEFDIQKYEHAERDRYGDIPQEYFDKVAKIYADYLLG